MYLLKILYFNIRGSKGIKTFDHKQISKISEFLNIFCGQWKLTLPRPPHNINRVQRTIQGLKFLKHKKCKVNIFYQKSVQFSHSIVSESLQPHELQYARLPCLSPTPGACSDSCPSSWWCHQTISSSVSPFSSCLQSFPASGSFLCIRWPKYWSFSFSISPSSEYSRLISFRIDWLDLLSVQGTLKSLL